MTKALDRPTSAAWTWALAAVATFGGVDAAQAPCPAWQTGFEGRGIVGTVNAVAGFDDGSGSGPMLHVGGDIDSAGAVLAQNIARWNGTGWLPLGAGLDGSVYAMVVFDDGSGPALYAGGQFTAADGQPADNIARWNGTSWSAVGTGLTGSTPFVRSLVLWDDGSGPALIAGGRFTSAGGIAANNLARWNGTAWSALVPLVPPVLVRTLAVWDDPAPGGPALFVAGGFTAPGFGLTRFDGTTWTGIGFNDCCVQALAAHDDGSGSALYVGGDFLLQGSVTTWNIARWNGTSWSAVGGGTGSAGGVYALLSFDDGSGFGPALHAAGNIGTMGGVPVRNTGRWDGTSWSPMGGGLYSFPLALAAFDDGSGGGASLYAGGAMSPDASQVIRGIARWNTTSWAAIDGASGGHGIDINRNEYFTYVPIVHVLAELTDAAGPALYAGGRFSYGGSVPMRNVGRWDGAGWTALGTGVTSPGIGGIVQALAGFDAGLGAGPTVIVGGSFTSAGGMATSNIAAWNGASWSTLGSGVNSQVFDLAVHDDGTSSALYVAGGFTSAGGVAANRIARWDGAGWSALGTGMNFNVATLCSFDDNLGGPDFLYAAGDFQVAGGVGVASIARWDGAVWSPVAGGLGGAGFPIAVASTVFDDGAGPALAVAGTFQSAGGVPASNVAQWNGTAWSALGGGLGGPVWSLHVHDDGSGNGRALYAAGEFTHAGGVPVDRIARWNGSAWSAVDVGVNGVAASLATFTTASSPPELFAGGTFTEAGARPSKNIARLGVLSPSACDVGSVLCAGDGLDPAVTTDCPCANFGGPGRGCASQANANGARLAASGATHVDPVSGTDTVVLAASGMPSVVSPSSIFLQGDALIAEGVVFGDGIRCADGQLIRLAIKPTPGGAAQFPDIGNLSVSQRGAVAPGSGAVRYYQTYYRSASPTFCPPATFNVTNGLRIAW